MVLLQWTSATDEEGTVNPAVIYYTLRMVMFILSFVLEDWAIHDLVHSPRYRKQAVILVASSYVTWTFQTHTFSNSVETLLVLWSLVLIERIVGEEVDRSINQQELQMLIPDRNDPPLLLAFSWASWWYLGLSTASLFQRLS